MTCENQDRSTRFENNMNVVVPKTNGKTVWTQCIRKSIFMHPHSFIVQHDHI